MFSTIIELRLVKKSEFFECIDLRMLISVLGLLRRKVIAEDSYMYMLFWFACVEDLPLR